MLSVLNSEAGVDIPLRKEDGSPHPARRVEQDNSSFAMYIS